LSIASSTISSKTTSTATPNTTVISNDAVSSLVPKVPTYIDVVIVSNNRNKDTTQKANTASDACTGSSSHQEIHMKQERNMPLLPPPRFPGHCHSFSPLLHHGLAMPSSFTSSSLSDSFYIITTNTATASFTPSKETTISQEKKNNNINIAPLPITTASPNRQTARNASSTTPTPQTLTPLLRPRQYVPPPPSPSPISTGAAETSPQKMLLSTPQDAQILNPLHCFVRSNVELFAATDHDISQPSPGRKQSIQLNQVGLRCIHCAHLPYRKRVKRAVCYPPAIGSIYHCVSNMKLDHFGTCKGLSDELRKEFEDLRKDSSGRGGGSGNNNGRSRGGGSGSNNTADSSLNGHVNDSGTNRGSHSSGIATAQFYHDSAKHLGLIDTKHGIRFATLTAAAVTPPPHNQGVDTATSFKTNKKQKNGLAVISAGPQSQEESGTASSSSSTATPSSTTTWMAPLSQHGPHPATKSASMASIAPRVYASPPPLLHPSKILSHAPSTSTFSPAPLHARSSSTLSSAATNQEGSSSSSNVPPPPHNNYKNDNIHQHAQNDGICALMMVATNPQIREEYEHFKRWQQLSTTR